MSGTPFPTLLTFLNWNGNLALQKTRRAIELNSLSKFAPRKTQIAQFYFAPKKLPVTPAPPPSRYLAHSPYERTGVRWRHNQIF